MEPKYFLEKVKEWLGTVDQEKVNFIIESNNYDEKSPTCKLRRVMSYYSVATGKSRLDGISDDEKAILTGERIVTLDDIAQLVLKRIDTDDEAYKVEIDLKDGDEDEYEDEDGSGYYDSAGYAGQALRDDIRSFWESFDEDSISSLADQDCLDLDLNGGRCYYMRGVGLYLFNYLYYTLKTPEAELEDNDEVWEDVSYYVTPELFLPSQEELDAIHNKEYDAYKSRRSMYFSSKIKDLIAEYGKDSFLSSKVEVLKTISHK